jgi:NAD(P)-dependent dehydrogenase (short-subunit alcohol dehydrogenase family)
VIVITGCTSGLGLHLSREFIRLGHTVIGCGRRAATIEDLNNEFSETQSSFYTVDVAKEADVIRFAQDVELKYGSVDMLISNAGLGGTWKLSWEIPSEALSNIVDVSLKGLMYTNKRFIPIMTKGLTPYSSGVKRVINISSGVGHTTMPRAADYCSVKFGVEGWSKCVAQEFKALSASEFPHWKDRIMCVPFAPGVVKTEMNSGRADAAPAEQWCKDAAPFLLIVPPEENGSSVTLPGYYSEEYMAGWIVPNGAKMNSTMPGGFSASQDKTK